MFEMKIWVTAQCIKWRGSYKGESNKNVCVYLIMDYPFG